MSLSKDEADKEARRRKIRQLEASLFPGGASSQGTVTTGLPELQRVGEYANQYGAAEQQHRRKKTGGMPSLRKHAKKMFFPDPRKNAINGGVASDEEDLLDSSVGSTSSSSSSESSSSTLDQSAAALPQAFKRQDSLLRKKLSTSSSNILLKSEVEQLDQSIRHLVKDPKQEVLENIKRRHGISRSPVSRRSFRERGLLFG